MAMTMYLTANKNSFNYVASANNLTKSDTIGYTKVWFHAVYENTGEEKLFTCPSFEKTAVSQETGVDGQGYFVNGRYIGDGKPIDERSLIQPTYGYNWTLHRNRGFKTSNIRKPSQSIFFADSYYYHCSGECNEGAAIDTYGYLRAICRSGSTTSPTAGDYSDRSLHGSYRNIAYLDCHVDSLDWKSLRVRWGKANSTDKSYGGTARYGYKDLTED
jgi:prepilin-type processing-associated H-X9-DG protein